MDEGSLFLHRSYFLESYENGINIKTAHQAQILNNFFRFSPDINFPSGTSTGVRISGSGLNADVQISYNEIYVINDVADIAFNGISLGGSPVTNDFISSGTNFFVTSNDEFRSQTPLYTGIHINGHFPEESHTFIFDNLFQLAPSVNTVAGDQGLTIGIYLVNGTKNNIHIFDNEFSGYFSNFTGHAAISADGPSTGVGNDIIGNELNRMSGVISTFCRITFGFENLEICSNQSDNNLLSGDYEIYGMNSGTTFSSNEMLNQGKLQIHPGGLIGPQEHMGNQFFNGSFLAEAVCDDPNDAPNNRFTVHTDQSNSQTGFFSEFHPEIVIPDVNDEFFWKDPNGGTPTNPCEVVVNFQGKGGSGDRSIEAAYIVPMDKMIPQDQIYLHPENLSGQHRLHRYLFKKLKNNPDLVSADPSFPSFISGLEGTNVDKFYQVEKDMESAIKAEESEDLPSEIILTEIKEVVDTLVIIDSLLEINDASSPEFAALAMQKEALYDTLQAKQATYSQIFSTYQQKRNQKLTQALASNNAIVPASAWEGYEQTVNEIRILLQTTQNGELTESQITELSNIAILCPEEGGYAVSEALGLLPECITEGLEYCTKLELQNFDTLVTSGSQSLVVQPHQKPRAVSSLAYPNPSKREFTISLDQQVPGKILVKDINGRILFSDYFDEHIRTKKVVHGFPAGFYVLTIQWDNGESQSEKLIIK